MISPNPRQSSPMATPRAIRAPVKARDPLDADVAPEPSLPDEPELPDDAAVEPATVVVVPPFEVDPLVVLVVVGVVVEVVVVDVVVVLEVVVPPVPGTADQTKPLGSDPLTVKVTTLFQKSVTAPLVLAQARPVFQAPPLASRLAAVAPRLLRSAHSKSAGMLMI